MLTRLKVNGFKNLVDVDLQFGPFTCIAGANGVGKSNLFDAIHFLSELASRPLLEAALSVRDEGGRTSNVRSLFHRVGDDYDDEISFEAEMIVPPTGIDDLGQTAEAGITFLRYSLTIGYRQANGVGTSAVLEILKEDLHHINLGDAAKNLNFPHKPAWRKSVIIGRRTAPFLSTHIKEGGRVIELHQDGRSGRTLQRSAATLPRTVLSTANAAETPTMLMARREMQSWKLLQLEPSSLRRPDEFNDQPGIGADGSHLPVTLYYLAGKSQDEHDELIDPERVYRQVANRLSNLLDDVRTVTVDRDDKRQLLSLEVTERDGTTHPARALSDGTLRFLALAVMEADPAQQGVICLEEPENGIHPGRIRAMLSLLEDIAMDTALPVGSDNPLRQVIINTHSPVVVGEIQDSDLIVAELKETIRNHKKFKRVVYGCLSKTWRAGAPSADIVRKGDLLAYLNPILPANSHEAEEKENPVSVRRKRVVDRDDLQQLQMRFPNEL